MIEMLEVIILIAIPTGWLYLVRLIVHRQNRIDGQLAGAEPRSDTGQSDVRRA